MTLNKQLLCVSLILLSLPWAGCQYLREMDSIMRSGQEQTLMASTEAIATVFSQQPAQLYPHGIPGSTRYHSEYNDNTKNNSTLPLYFHPLPSPMLVDGYDEGWQDIPAIEYQGLQKKQQTVRYRAGIVNQQLFLFFEVIDNEIIYNNPANSLINDGDRLVLVTANNTSYSFTTAAPGKVTARYDNGSQGIYRESKISAHWQDTAQGYNIELSLPVKLAAGRLGFYIVDQDTDSETISETTYGQLSAEKISQPPLYIYQPQSLKQQLAIFKRNGLRLKIIDPYFWLLSHSGSLKQNQQSSGHWLIRKLYRSLLDSQPDNNPEYRDPKYSNQANHSSRKEVIESLKGKPSNEWYRDTSRPNHYILASAAPIRNNGKVIGVIVAEQSSEQLIALSDNAFNRLVLLSLGAISFVALGLLGYASWLSWRIRRLSHAATEVISDDGKLIDNFPQSRANDEIGDLTRNYGQLLNRISDYTQYLQTLSRKLSHELRTPLAIIHSSLDNLNNQPLDQQSVIYQQRAKEGALRLGNILSAMSEANRVEESINNAEPEQIDILSLLNDVIQAYQDLYKDHRISFQHKNPMQIENNILSAVPDLLVQMLDKLIDNAVGFCPKQGSIECVFHHQGDTIAISIANDGPPLPEKMRSQLFDNMVSLREQNQNSSHLGLGLYIVDLIVKYHNGKISAANREGNSGAVFTIVLPTKSAASN